MVKGIGHVAFKVKDMAKSVEFYEKTFGFKKAFDIPNPKDGKPWIVYLYGAGQFIELFYDGKKEVPYDDDNIGFLHICLEVDDINEAWKKVVEAGAPQDIAPNQGSDLNLQAWTHDPDWNKIEIMQLDPESPQVKALKAYK